MWFDSFIYFQNGKYYILAQVECPNVVTMVRFIPVTCSEPCHGSCAIGTVTMTTTATTLTGCSTEDVRVQGHGEAVLSAVWAVPELCQK